MFQFHSGSIQTQRQGFSRMFFVTVSIPLWFDSNRDGLSAHIGRLVAFQFHSGSIQTSAQCRGVRQSRCFNSTLVRFKQSGVKFLDQGETGFNSTLVRFKLRGRLSAFVTFQDVSIPLWFDSNDEVVAAAASKSSFQFHSGSIQTDTFRTPSADTQRFQFHSGSIQTLRSVGYGVAWDCFNSTLVRFKLPQLHSNTTTHYTFQFHSGSIQTGVRSVKRRNDKRVSIPLWFDSNTINKTGLWIHNVVSIPLWFDSNATSAQILKPSLAVSIPLWFDSNM